MSWLLTAFLMIGSVGLSLVLAPRPPQARPTNNKELDVPTAETGKPIPVIFGTVLLQNPNVVWYGDVRTEDIKSASGGK